MTDTYHIIFTDDVTLLEGQAWVTADLHNGHVLRQLGVPSTQCIVAINLVETSEITMLMLQGNVRAMDITDIGLSVRSALYALLRAGSP